MQIAQEVDAVLGKDHRYQRFSNNQEDGTPYAEFVNGCARLYPGYSLTCYHRIGFDKSRFGADNLYTGQFELGHMVAVLVPRDTASDNDVHVIGLREPQVLFGRLNFNVSDLTASQFLEAMRSVSIPWNSPVNAIFAKNPSNVIEMWAAGDTVVSRRPPAPNSSFRDAPLAAKSTLPIAVNQ